MQIKWSLASGLIVLALLLAACGGAGGSAPASPAVASPIPEVVVTPAPAVEATAAGAQAGAAEHVEVESGATAAPSQPGEVRLFTIDSSRSEVLFILDEELFGTPTTVIGRNSDVSGSVSIAMDDVSQVAISEIRIDARTLTTDNSRRNGAIARFILQSNEARFHYIVFTPTEIQGLPGSASTGETLNLTVLGDLTIRDVTKPVVFDLTVTAVTESELHGRGAAVVQRADFDLTIPSVPSVANVSEEVELQIEFVAVAEQ
jgi:polyisoprenoid-binding protein YceI